jgi:hypothetical protein
MWCCGERCFYKFKKKRYVYQSGKCVTLGLTSWSSLTTSTTFWIETKSGGDTILDVFFIRTDLMFEFADL